MGRMGGGHLIREMEKKTLFRPDFWKRLPFPGCCKTILTEGYDDHELGQVLQLAGRHLQNVPYALRPLIRRPRYCDLILHHFERMADDPTVERLLYEDYRSRLEKKTNHPVTPEDFRQILSSLAQEYRDGISSFRRHTVTNLFSGESDADAAIQEIIDGGLLIESGSISTPFRVERRRLIHGLGMLLADHLLGIGNRTVSEHIENIGAWLEPGAEMDIKAPVVGAAIFFAMIAPLYPSTARRALLEYWLCRRNVPDEEDIITAYLPECPEDVLAVADAFWGEKVDNQVAEERLTGAILSRRDHPAVKPALIDATKRWMSYVNIGGYPSRADIHGDAREKAIAAIREKLGKAVCAGDEIRFDNWTFQAIDDDIKLFLSHLALKVISSGDRLPFIEAFVNWAISRAIIGKHFEEEEVAWALRLTNEPVWETLKTDLEFMSRSTNNVLREAANSLLWCLGRRECNELRKKYLGDLHPKPQWLLEHETDPCKGFFSINRDLYQECLTREDLSFKAIFQKLGQYIANPDLQAPQRFLDLLVDESHSLPIDGFRRSPMGKTAEEGEIDRFVSVAARFLPALAGHILRSIVRDIPKRNVELQSNLLSYLPKITILLNTDEISILHRALVDIRLSILESESGKDKKFSEADGTLALLFHLSPDDVTREIINRPTDTFDDLNYLLYCQIVSPDLSRFLKEQLLISQDTKYLLRILWLLPIVTSNQLTQGQEAKLLEFLSGEDRELRFGAMRFAYCSENYALVDSVLQDQVPFFTSNSSQTNACGAAILCYHGLHLPFNVLSERLSLPDLIRAIKIRGCVPEEINLLVQILHKILNSSTLPVVKFEEDGLVSKVAQREKHALWAITIDLEIISRICQEFPSIVNSWAGIVLDGNIPILHIFPGFYHSLCEVLLKQNSEVGIPLWRKIKLSRGTSISVSGVDWLALMAFSALSQLSGAEVCDELLQFANSDIELYQLVQAAIENKQESWVSSKAVKLLESANLWERGKGLMLIALSDSLPGSFEDMVNNAKLSGSWLETPSETMKDIFDLNQWGKYWYQQFLALVKEDEAFSAWLLFLKCIDGRFRKWMRELDAEYGMQGHSAERRILFCKANESNIQHAIEKKEKEYADHFCTIKMSSSSRDRISPFYQTTDAAL